MGVFDASKLPPTCIQNVTFHYYYEPNVDNMTEDCLHLNLWVPYSRNSTQLKPIIIFIHGGALNVGSSNMKVYDGTNLAKFGDVIIANISNELDKDNARSFGGDPNHIVLMGESAGGHDYFRTSYIPTHKRHDQESNNAKVAQQRFL
ncbi:carboxylic ester hydrolase [Caerostris extrusa]|uniref:Carboxylic ester hydrolase n=1 Tax=Caerostris extrusa TaxID=172846 RepID=A0AAV4V3D4_CAEEX|nr:carboxylic ester hydrolase [Caerostris extrusa]